MTFISGLLRKLGLRRSEQTGFTESRAQSPVSPDAPPRDVVPTPAPAPVRRKMHEKGEPSDLIEQAHSPNKRWSVGLAIFDVEPDGRLKRRIHLRDNETGRMVPAVGLVRSMGASVSNIGTFAVNDAGEYDSGLHSDLIVYDSEGVEIYRRTYGANLYSVGISPCGRYAAGQTARSGNEDDFLLEAHDVQEKRILMSRRSVTGLNEAFAYDTDANTLRKLFVVDRKLGRFAYAGTGEFIDEAKYLDARLSKGDYATRITAARELVGANASPEAATRALSAVETALKEAGSDNGWLAAGLRAKGELLEILERKPEAIEAYRAALEKNPKVGARKRLTTLEKQMERLDGKD